MPLAGEEKASTRRNNPFQRRPAEAAAPVDRAQDSLFTASASRAVADQEPLGPVDEQGYERTCRHQIKRAVRRLGGQATIRLAADAALSYERTCSAISPLPWASPRRSRGLAICSRSMSVCWPRGNDGFHPPPARNVAMRSVIERNGAHCVPKL